MSTPRDRLLEAFRSVDAGVEPEDIGLESEDPLLFAFRQARAGVEFSPTQFKDVGVARAFFGGVKEGFLEPLTIFGREGEVLRLDETSEKVANVLGSFTGLALGFIPFAAGTGVVLKGIGLTRLIPKVIVGVDAAGTATRVANPLYGFVRNTVAGAAQFAGISEELEDVPKNLAIGVTFGAAIEGLFLAKALRGRRGFVRAGDKDIPVDLDLLAREAEVSPGLNKSAQRMRTEIEGLGKEDFSYEEILSELTRTDIETVRIPGLSKSSELVKSAKASVPEAQVLSRTTQGGRIHEVLVHNPIDEASRLTPKQVAQWKNIGFYEGQPVIFDGKTLVATGVPVEPGFVQVRNPAKPKTEFAVRANEVVRPLSYSAPTPENVARQRILRTAVADAEVNMGFTIPAATVGEGAALSAKRGVVDLSEFELASSLDIFLNSNAAEIAAIEAATRQEALAIFARNKGIKGVQVEAGGITTKVHVFDQSAVSFVKEPPRISAVQPAQVTGLKTLGSEIVESPAIRTKEGVVVTGSSHMDALTKLPRELQLRLDKITDEKLFDREVTMGFITSKGRFVNRGETQRLRKQLEKIKPIPEGAAVIPNVGLDVDQAVVSTTLEGKTVLHSFTPSWKNSIMPAFRKQGLSEKEINNLLELHLTNLDRRLEGLLDDEFLAAKKASELQFGDCI